MIGAFLRLVRATSQVLYFQGAKFEETKKKVLEQEKVQPKPIQALAQQQPKRTMKWR